MTLLPSLMKIGKLVQSQYRDTAAHTDTCNMYQRIRLVFLLGKPGKILSCDGVAMTGFELVIGLIGLLDTYIVTTLHKLLSHKD
jgi:hypothetical protein